MAYTTIKKPSDYFNTKLYTGNGSAGNSITGVGFQPDWTWIKNRDAANWHQTFDAVRTASSGTLYTNQTSAEDFGGGNLLASFDSDGFTVNTNTGVNANGQNLVAWNWKCETGVSGTTTGSGSERSYSGRVNTTAGISIINYAGNTSAGHTIPHHLGVAPKMIIVKNLGDVGNWMVYHASTTDFRYYLKLNSSDGTVLDSAVFDNVPTSSGFLVGSNVDVNDDNQQYIAYCFAEKTGYSKFGSYVGNGNADGTFVYTGFKPAFVIQKQTSASGEFWMMKDNKRVGYNQTDANLYPNHSNQEVDTNGIDLLSNGFKCRTTGAGSNASGATYIYMAFAEEPLVGDNPATAR